jgi:hypothetical protein
MTIFGYYAKPKPFDAGLLAAPGCTVLAVPHFWLRVEKIGVPLQTCVCYTTAGGNADGSILQRIAYLCPAHCATCGTPLCEVDGCLTPMIIRACAPLVRNLWIEQSKTRFAAETKPIVSALIARFHQC